MVRLGDDVPCALVVDPLDPFVVVHQHDAGAHRELAREPELSCVSLWRLGRFGGRVACDGPHGDAHSALSGRTVVPSSVKRCVKVTVAPGSICGLNMNPPLFPVRSTGSVTRHVVWPAWLPLFLTV